MSPRTARAKRRLTLAEACAGIGEIDPGNLSRIERGVQAPERATGERILGFYAGDVDWADLYATPPSPLPPSPPSPPHPPGRA